MNALFCNRQSVFWQMGHGRIVSTLIKIVCCKCARWFRDVETSIHNLKPFAHSCHLIGWKCTPRLVFTRGQFWPSGIVIACVCVSVRVSVCVCINHLLVRTITHQPFTLESPNLGERRKTPWLRCILFWDDWTCKSNFTSFWDCPHDNFSLVIVRITKLRPEMHLSMAKKPIVLGVDWPWSSMSNLTCKSKFIPFWACPYNNLSPVQAKITKYGPDMHLNTVKIPVDFGRDKPSDSISFLIVKAMFLTYLRCFVSHLVRPCRKS